MKMQKSLWRVVTLSVVLAAGSGVLVAQAAKAVQEKFVPRAFVAQMASVAQHELNLTSDQKTKVKAILQDAIPRGIAIHDDMQLDAATKRTRLQQLHDETKARVDALLNADQREKLGHWRETAEKRARQAFAQVGDKLNLSEEQRTKIKPIVEDGFAQARALKDDMNLTVAQKFARLGQIRKETRSRVDGVLTREQRTQLDQISAEMRSEVRRQLALWREKNPAL
jgi:hypothetical protein